MFSLQMKYCGERGIAHSEFLSWSDEDQSKALAWMMEEASLCGMCGTAGWEWEENRFAYDPVEEICPGCERKELMQDDPTRDSRPGARIVLRKP